MLAGREAMLNTATTSLCSPLSRVITRVLRQTWSVCFYARVPFLSIFFDDWAAIRSADSEAKASIAAEIIRRRRRGAKVQKLIGVGYTPRIVALAGLMLRSLHLSTALPALWDPPIGLGAGACLAAQWAQREWLACLMVGWYVGGIYWKDAMGVVPPSDFAGVPVFVRRVRV